MLSGEMVAAVNQLQQMRQGDLVTLHFESRDHDMVVSREARRSDGAFGSVESTHITVTYGPGRWSTEVRAEWLVSGKQSLARRSEGQAIDGTYECVGFSECRCTKCVVRKREAIEATS